MPSRWLRVHESCPCRDRLSVMWNRMYGKEKFANLYDKYHACSQLNMMLGLTACKRLVIGHTPQVLLDYYVSLKSFMSKI